MWVFLPSRRQHPRRLSYPDASPRLRPVPRGNPVSFIPSESAHTCLANASYVLQPYLRVCHDPYPFTIFDSVISTLARAASSFNVYHVVYEIFSREELALLFINSQNNTSLNHVEKCDRYKMIILLKYWGFIFQ